MKDKVESILFAINKPIAIKKIAKFCDCSCDELEVVLESLKADYNQEEKGINIICKEDSIQMVVCPNNSELIASILNEQVNSDLTRPQLETLTVIAYRGPITKLELEQVRGVNCGMILRNLLIKDLVEVKEDKVIDNNTYSISLEFMKHLGITSIDELPNYVELNKKEELDELVV